MALRHHPSVDVLAFMVDRRQIPPKAAHGLFVKPLGLFRADVEVLPSYARPQGGRGRFPCICLALRGVYPH